MATHIRFSSRRGYLGNSNEVKSIPFGTVITPFAKLGEFDEVQNIEVVEDNIGDLRCTNCGAFATPIMRSTKMACSICGVTNVIPTDHGKNPNLASECVQIVSGDSTELPHSSVVFVIDTHLQPYQLRDVHDSIKATINAIGKHKVQLCLIVISRVVTVYRCCLDGVVSGDVFGSIDSMKLLPDHRVTSYLTSASASLDSFLTCLLSIRGARKPCIRNQSANPRRRKLMELLPRNLMLAMEISLHILRVAHPTSSSSESTSSRIIVCLDGYPNVDASGVSQPPTSLSSSAMLPGEVARLNDAHASMSAMAHDAVKQCVGIDICCSGLQSINAPLLYDLVSATGGIVLVQQSFAPSEFGCNLNKLLLEQVILSKDNYASLEIISSEAVKIAHLGPASCSHDGDFTHQLKFRRLDPRASLGLYLEFSPRDTSDIYIQCIAHSNIDNKHFRRISSFKFERTSDESLFFDSVDEEVVVVLLAKAAAQNANDYAVGQCMETLRLASCERLDSWLSDLTQYYLKGVAKSGNDVLERALPTAMSGCLVRYLYFLRFGILLGDTHNAFDDLFCLRWLFLRMDLQTCLAMIAPRALSTRTDQANQSKALAPLPADTLVLWSDAFVVGDMFNKIVVWRGQEANVLNAPEEAIAQYLAPIYQDRFPAPTVVRCTEGSSMARIIVSRLNPSHHDSLKDQCLSLPALVTLLSQEQREQLYRKFPKTDTPSVVQWLRKAVSAK